MSDTIIMTDWVRGGGGTSSVVTLQPEPFYLDFSGGQDFASYVEVSELSGSPNIRIQTAPIKEELYFQDLLTVSPVGAGITVTVVRWETASLPPAQWLRWNCGSAVGAFSATFRILLNVNPAPDFYGGTRVSFVGHPRAMIAERPEMATSSVAGAGGAGLLSRIADMEVRAMRLKSRRPT